MKLRASTVMLLQGIYYCLTGLWPLLHLRSFEGVTGAKGDEWLVRAVGALVLVQGAGLLLGVRRGQAPEEVRAIALGSDLALAAIDLKYVLARRISPVYLLDAAAELGLAALWLRASYEPEPPRREPVTL